jgi:hypothetical protein
MSAVEALKQARVAGIRVGIDGDFLDLEASVPPPPEVLDLLARYKAEVLTLVRRRDSWSAEDWLELYAERCAIAEFDGGLLHDQAEFKAFSCCISEWLRRNPVRSPPGRCKQCGKTVGVLSPYLSDCSLKDPDHTWLHHECAEAWHVARRDSAVTALRAIGIAIGSCQSDAEKEIYDQTLRRSTA